VLFLSLADMVKNCRKAEAVLSVNAANRSATALDSSAHVVCPSPDGRKNIINPCALSVTLIGKQITVSKLRTTYINELITDTK